MNYKIVQLKFDHATKSIYADNYKLHCGDCFEVLIVNEKGDPVWFDTRIEMDKTYYLIDLPNISPIGLFAKMPE